MPLRGTHDALGRHAVDVVDGAAEGERISRPAASVVTCG